MLDILFTDYLKFFIDPEKPNKFMIFIWDKFFIPVSYLFDKLIFYKIGKNLIVIIKKVKSK